MNKNIYFIMVTRTQNESIENIQKSHTWEEGGGTPQNFCLAFIDELEKQIIIKKTVEVGQ